MEAPASASAIAQAAPIPWKIRCRQGRHVEAVRKDVENFQEHEIGGVIHTSRSACDEHVLTDQRKEGGRWDGRSRVHVMLILCMSQDSRKRGDEITG